MIYLDLNPNFREFYLWTRRWLLKKILLKCENVCLISASGTDLNVWISDFDSNFEFGFLILILRCLKCRNDKFCNTSYSFFEYLWMWILGHRTIALEPHSVLLSRQRVPCCEVADESRSTILLLDYFE
ncbi:hypothetical protein RCL_jg12064.t1 [Rhizophagus clarus]|uniref:Uncharacterized protein n=1 Tax=Rhizophagus clarus TaxID=94130 RepID=A0A8H3L7T4_9GLOM|nr:hypothetical protein RCL_jg12064.t1 [Rhizophagus clarus]